MSLLDAYDGIPADDTVRRIGFVYKTLRTDWRGLFDELRARRPLFACPAFVMVTRHADVIGVLSQPELFSVRGYAAKMDPSVGPFMLARDKTSINWHEKAVMRSVLRHDDLPRVRRLAGNVARRALDAAGDCVDLVPSVARRVPLRVVQRYFGLDAPERTMLRWSKATQTDMFRNFFDDGAAHAANIAAGAELRDWLRARLAATGPDEPPSHRSSNTVLGRLQNGLRSSDVSLDAERLAANMAGLLVGAIETSSQAIVQATEQILRRPDVRRLADAAAAARDQAAFDAIVWEALRFNPITVMVLRTCERQTVLAPGTPHALPVAPGTIVAVCTGSAMFDEAVVDDPSAFRAGRPDACQFHFGLGHHECLGRHVGMQIVPEAVRQVLLTPGLEQIDGPDGEIDFAGGAFPEHFRVRRSAPWASRRPEPDQVSSAGPPLTSERIRDGSTSERARQEGGRHPIAPGGPA